MDEDDLAYDELDDDVLTPEVTDTEEWVSEYPNTSTRDLVPALCQ